MKPLLAIPLKFRDEFSEFWGYIKNDKFVLCYDVFTKLFPKAKEAESLVLSVYCRPVRGAVRIYANYGPLNFHWKLNRLDKWEYIYSGDVCFQRYLTKKPKRFWLTVTKIKKIKKAKKIKKIKKIKKAI